MRELSAIDQILPGDLILWKSRPRLQPRRSGHRVLPLVIHASPQGRWRGARRHRPRHRADGPARALFQLLGAIDGRQIFRDGVDPLSPASRCRPRRSALQMPVGLGNLPLQVQPRRLSGLQVQGPEGLDRQGRLDHPPPATATAPPSCSAFAKARSPTSPRSGSISKQFVERWRRRPRQGRPVHMATGAVGQSVWSYLTSHHSDHAIGDSGLAICYASNYPLDSGAATPNHAFEVVSTTRLTSLSLPDASPKAILIDFFTNARYGLPGWTSGQHDMTSMSAGEAYCLAAKLVLSPVLDQARTGVGLPQGSAAGHQFDLRLVRGPAQVHPLRGHGAQRQWCSLHPQPDPGLCALDDEQLHPPVRWGRPADDRHPGPVRRLQHRPDRISGPLQPVQHGHRHRSGYGQYRAIRSAQAKPDHHPFRSAPRRWPRPAPSALSAQRTLYIRGQYKFVLPWTYALLEPGDIVRADRCRPWAERLSGAHHPDR